MVRALVLLIWKTAPRMPSAPLKQVELGAQLVALVLLGLGARVVEGEDEGLRGGVERGAVGEVVGLLLGGQEHQGGARAQRLVGPRELLGREAVAEVGVEEVVAQAAHDPPLVGDRHLVHRVDADRGRRRRAVEVLDPPHAREIREVVRVEERGVRHAGEGVALDVGRLLGGLDARDQGVLEHPRVELHHQVGGVDDARVLLAPLGAGARHLDRAQRGGRGRGAHDGRDGHEGAPVDHGQAQRVAQAHVLVEVVLEAQGADVDVVVLVVPVGNAVEVLPLHRPVHRRRLAEEIREAVVGDVVVVQVEVAHDEARGAVEPDAERRRRAQALHVHVIAPRRLALEAHEVEAQRSRWRRLAG